MQYVNFCVDCEPCLDDAGKVAITGRGGFVLSDDLAQTITLTTQKKRVLPHWITPSGGMDWGFFVIPKEAVQGIKARGAFPRLVEVLSVRHALYDSFGAVVCVYRLEAAAVPSDHAVYAAGVRYKLLREFPDMVRMYAHPLNGHQHLNVALGSFAPLPECKAVIGNMDPEPVPPDSVASCRLALSMPDAVKEDEQEALAALSESVNGTEVFYEFGFTFGELLSAAEGCSNEVFPCRIRAIDDALGGGFPETGIFLYGGEPGAGKSTIVQEIAEGLASTGRTVLYYSLEMSRRDLISRSLLSAYARKYTPAGSGTEGARLSDEIMQALKTRGRFRGVDIRDIADEQYTHNRKTLRAKVCLGATIEDIQGDIEAHIAANPGALAPVVVVDYLQQIRARDSRLDDVRRLQLIGDTFKDLGQSKCLLIAVSALSREGIKTLREFTPGMDDPAVMQSAFKGSGQLEYSASMAYLIRKASQGRRSVFCVKNRDREGVSLTLSVNLPYFNVDRAFDGAGKLETASPAPAQQARRTPARPQPQGERHPVRRQ